MKHVLMIILSVILATALYIPCRKYAVEERGNKAYGGEILIPAAVMIGAVCLICNDEEKEDK